MTVIATALSLLLPIKTESKPAVLPEYPLYGHASYYGQSPTVATLEYRLAVGDLNHKHLEFATVFIAVGDCGRIGEHGYITINDSEPMPYAVFDCANRSDGTIFWMRDNRIAVELDYYTTETFVPLRDGAVVVLEPIGGI